MINNFITSAGEAIDEYAQGCRGTHDTYKIRLTKVLQNIKDILKNESEDDTAPDIEKEATEIMVGNYDLMIKSGIEVIKEEEIGSVVYLA